MRAKAFSNRKIAIALICVLVLGLLSVVGAMAANMKMLNLMDSINPEVNASVTELGQFIQKGEDYAVLQQQLEKVIGSNEQLGDLFIIDQNAVILAAKDIDAVGLAYPISFRSNLIKGLPLPFSYEISEMPRPADRYKVSTNPDEMFKFFGTYKAPDNNIYHIIGYYRVAPDLIDRQNQISGLITFGLQVYRISFILFWLLLPLWVYRDARRRPTNAAAWGILTLVTSVIGWLVYLIARPSLGVCPNCGQEQSSSLKFCTGCGTLLKTCCSECGSELDKEWEYCGSCGHKIGPGSGNGL